MNFIPCANCADTLYCNDEKCANNAVHKTECDMMLGAEDCCDGESLTFLNRTILVAINTFPTVHALMEFVEKCRESDPLDITESLDTSIAKYRTFFKLASTVTSKLVSDNLKIAYFAYHAIMGSNLGKKFDTKDSQRFLMHLTIHHDLIIRANAFSGYTEPPSGTFGQKNSHLVDDNEQFQRQVHLLTSYFNHSCLPNVIKLGKDNLAVCKALLPIKQGERLFITYIDDESFGMTEKQRNDQLESIYGFRCKCEFCRKGNRLYRPGEGLQMQTDADFKYIATNLPRLVERFDAVLLQEIKRRCIYFLKRYHPQLIATREAAFVLTNLVAMLEKELNGR